MALRDNAFSATVQIAKTGDGSIAEFVLRGNARGEGTTDYSDPDATCRFRIFHPVSLPQTQTVAGTRESSDISCR
jgi:hypothetical protein